MKLKFNEEHNLVCPECGSKYFKADITTSVEMTFDDYCENNISPNIDKYSIDINKRDLEYIQCTECDYVIATDFNELNKLYIEDKK